MVRMFALMAAMLVAVSLLAPEYAPRLLAAIMSSGEAPPATAREEFVAAAPREEEPRGPRGRVVLAADRRGHFMVDGFVGARGLTLMVDTGATSVALTQETARKVGVNPPQSAFRYPVSTANGTIRAARVTLPSLTVEGIRINGVEAMVLPDRALDTNLLGMTYLSRLSGFEVQGDRLILAR